MATEPKVDTREKCSSDTCETSPDAPFNQHPLRPLGTQANADEPHDREDELERQKQYYKGGKKP